MQHRSLIRVPDLSAFRDALITRALGGDPLASRARAIIVPTTAAADLLRSTIEAAAERAGRRAMLLPDLLTRDEWMAALHRGLADPAPLLTRIERELILTRAARAAATRGWLDAAPFALRPGLVARMLDFYDELRRRQRTVRRFARAIFDELRHERGTDTGSEGLIHQTTFLGLAFLGYERLVGASGRLDEHRLRHALTSGGVRVATPYTHVIVAVADHPADPRGLWPVDFDLLGRLTDVARLDVVVTEESHDAGFRERAEQELPGIEEVAIAPAVVRTPVVVVPRLGETSAPDGDRGDGRRAAVDFCLRSRDREEEMRDVARAIRRRFDEDAHAAREPVAIVFHRPLPYLYLGRHVLTDARIPFQAFDALPLAAEPYAALLDLVLAVARTGGTREAAIALLRSRLVRCAVGGTTVGLRDAAALDAALAARRATGEADTYSAEVRAFFADRPTREGHERARAERAAAAAADIRAALQPFRDGETASAQLRALARFLRVHEAAHADLDAALDADIVLRHARARAAVLSVVDALAAAFEAYDDSARTPGDLAAHLHHVIESRTFMPRRRTAGVHVVDAMAARFGDFDHVHLVGLVETDWPERARRSIFYTTSLLKSLGWPQESAQARAQHAAFRDLVRLPSRTLRLHAFQLEGDAAVAPSPLLEIARDLPVVEEGPAVARRLFPDETLTSGAPPVGLEPEAAAWLALRQARPPLDDRRYGGFVAPRAPEVYRVSRVDRFVDCPFKYFAESVLGLPEERDEMAGLTPLEAGTLVHSLFEAFYRGWHADGRGTITPALLPDAIERFTRLTEQALARLPEADRVLERTRLLGSIVARGLAERVFELEADTGGQIVNRLIEFTLAGPFVFPLKSGLEQRTIQIRGKADRIDVFADGTLRVIDYKLGKQPDVDVSVQIGVYAHCAQQRLESDEGRPHPVQSAMYLAFGDDRRLEGKLGTRPADVAFAVGARASDFASAVGRIERGEFPPRPRQTGLCQICRFAGVCRKEYRLDDEAVEVET